MLNRPSPLIRLAGAAALLIVGSAAASAQFYGPRPFFYGYAGPIHSFGPVYSGPAYRPGPRFLHPADVTEILRDKGFRAVDVLHRQGDVFVVNAVSPRTGRTRLIVDAYEGEILERFAVGSQRPVTTTGSVTPRPATLPPARPATRAAPPPSASAQAPLPPRRPAASPTPQPAQNQPVSRRPSDWAPINSVPPAALE